MSTVRDIGKIFIQPSVQNILKKITGFNPDKIFNKTFNSKLKLPKIELLSHEDLEEYQRKSNLRAEIRLQMPPVMKAREPCEKVIQEDPELNLFNTKNSKFMFIDITKNIPGRKRKIVVRESNGNLRHASWTERDKMLSIYYPTNNGHSITKPTMFNSDILEERLSEKRYLQILNEASVQYEPDDSEFIRVTSRVYEVVNKGLEFEELKSTRFYGPFVFYLTWYKDLDNIISHYLKEKNVDDLKLIGKLYYILNPEAESVESVNFDSDEMTTLKSIELLILKELKENQKSELALKEFFVSKDKINLKAT